MSLPKAHISDKAVSINLCCVTDKDKKKNIYMDKWKRN